jgi:DNA-binding transcriptional regulator YhcF (GntR family)
MQLWFTRGSKVTIHEQFVTQIILGILSGDLAPGQRLPSTRNLAWRFRIHNNTVRAGYDQLAREGWVEARQGSGVYVRESKPEIASSATLKLEGLMGRLMHSAREMGVPLSSVRTRLRQWLELQPPDHFLLLEPDEELRRILVAEMERTTTFPVRSSGLDGYAKAGVGAIPVVMPNRARAVRQTLPEGIDMLVLKIRSVATSLVKWLPAPKNKLVGVASSWPDFLTLANTFLRAAGFHPDALVFRDARRAGWKDGLRQTAAVVCDTITITQLPPSCRAISFPLLSDDSVEELKLYVEFVTRPMELCDEPIVRFPMDAVDATQSEEMAGAEEPRAEASK